MLEARRELTRENLKDIAARYQLAATTPHPFLERLVRFWSNHFAVSVDKGTARLYAAPMEREAIRPHVLGKFSALLIAVASHPAMLRYLDHATSIGDASMRATRARNRANASRRRLGFNGNLAREILERHTLGVNGGYAQADVTELARAITGWSTVYGKRAGDQAVDAALADTTASNTGFVFRQGAHEPGTRRVLGRSCADDGVQRSRRCGGRIAGDWPGLAKAQWNEGRDLRATTDLRGLCKALALDPLGVAEGAVEASLFPDSRQIRPLDARLAS